MAEQYLEICRLILKKGQKKKDRTGVGTISYFGVKMEFDLSCGFPLLTTKKISFNEIAKELKKTKKWVLDTDKLHLNIFVEKLKKDQKFAKNYGSLGPIYGKQ